MEMIIKAFLKIEIFSYLKLSNYFVQRVKILVYFDRAGFIVNLRVKWFLKYLVACLYVREVKSLECSNLN